jgi:hypothetical protein
VSTAPCNVVIASSVSPVPQAASPSDAATMASVFHSLCVLIVTSL